MFNAEFLNPPLVDGCPVGGGDPTPPFVVCCPVGDPPPTVSVVTVIASVRVLVILLLLPAVIVVVRVVIAVVDGANVVEVDEGGWVVGGAVANIVGAPNIE